MKICKDCKHCDIGVSGIEFAVCNSPKNSKGPDPVSGEEERIYKFCSTQRQQERDLIDRFFGRKLCFAQGFWFEPKEEE